MQRAVLDREGYAVDGMDAAELFDQAIGNQNLRRPWALSADRPAAARVSSAVLRPAMAAASINRVRNGAMSRPTTPTRPVGENTMNPTNKSPNQKQPVRGPDRQELAEQDEEERAERRAEKAAHSADHHHGDQLARERDGQRLGRREAMIEN